MEQHNPSTIALGLKGAPFVDDFASAEHSNSNSPSCSSRRDVQSSGIPTSPSPPRLPVDPQGGPPVLQARTSRPRHTRTPNGLKPYCLELAPSGWVGLARLGGSKDPGSLEFITACWPPKRLFYTQCPVRQGPHSCDELHFNIVVGD